MYMLNSVIITVALTLNLVDDSTLTKWYWDCDTDYMRQQLSGQDLNTCLSVTNELQRRLFNNDRDRFFKWWEEQHRDQWYNRGYGKGTV
jgi:hypothetical protein